MHDPTPPTMKSHETLTANAQAELIAAVQTAQSSCLVCVRAKNIGEQENRIRCGLRQTQINWPLFLCPFQSLKSHGLLWMVPLRIRKVTARSRPQRVLWSLGLGLLFQLSPQLPIHRIDLLRHGKVAGEIPDV